LSSGIELTLLSLLRAALLWLFELGSSQTP